METTYKNSYKKVHIGDDVWGCGKVNENYRGTKEKHMVIYGPNNSQYQIFGKDVDFVTTTGNLSWHWYGECYEMNTGTNKHGNYAVESKLKIFILTSILDKPTNWCFDIKKIPANGNLKVIYENGTVKNINFDGMFIDADIPYRWSKDRSRTWPAKAFGYRKSNF